MSAATRALNDNARHDETAPRTAAHLVPIGEGWTLWRSVCLRGAGFAAKHVVELAMPECARAVDAFLLLEARCESKRREALRVCDDGNKLGVSGAGSDLTRAMKALRAGKAPAPFEASAVVTAALADFAEALTALEEQRVVVQRAFAETAPVTGQLLRRAASDAGLRKAMLWQNRGVIKGTVDALLRKPAGAVDSKTREHERLMASYLQRYCVKNDTIGFFGPVGWGTIVDRREAMTLRAGPGLLARRNVYFESWGMQLLAAQLSADPELRLHVAPRRMPVVRLEGNVLFQSLGRSTELPIEYARIIHACDGMRTAAEIAALLCADATLGLSGDEEVYCLLDQLVDKRVLSWSLDIPTTLAHPERQLSALLARAAGGPARDRALAALAELEAARDVIARGSDDEAALDQGLGELESAFERITGVSAKRRGGQAYAGRTLVFEDCVRDVRLELGTSLIDRLAPPLRLLLQAARWYTFEIGRRYHAALSSAHAALHSETGAQCIELVHFLSAVEGLFTGSQALPAPIVRDVIDELHARWTKVLQVSSAVQRVELSVAELRSAVAQAFAAPHPGWPGARYHSPDIMIAAASVEAVRRGEYFFVMGELHTGDNTASNPVFVHQHPEPATLVHAVEHDLAEPRICPVVPKERSTRADQISLSRRDFDVEFGTTRSARPRSQVLAAGDLVVEQVGDGLFVRTRDGSQRFHALAFFENYLKLESIAHFTLLPSAPHTPRVSIDGLVVARERWRFEPQELDFASQPEPVDRFIAARRWAARHAVARMVFVKIPEETKPCFVDLESPIFVEILAKLARRASSLTVSEMLPAVDDAWLVDNDARAYTSELRLVAVDPQGWRAP